MSNSALQLQKDKEKNCFTLAKYQWAQGKVQYGQNMAGGTISIFPPKSEISKAAKRRGRMHPCPKMPGKDPRKLHPCRACFIAWGKGGAGRQGAGHGQASGVQGPSMGQHGAWYAHTLHRPRGRMGQHSTGRGKPLGTEYTQGGQGRPQGQAQGAGYGPAAWPATGQTRARGLASDPAGPAWQFAKMILILV